MQTTKMLAETILNTIENFDWSAISPPDPDLDYGVFIQEFKISLIKNHIDQYLAAESSQESPYTESTCAPSTVPRC